MESNLVLAKKALLTLIAICLFLGVKVVVATSSEKSIPAVVPTSSEKSTSAVEPTSSEKSIPAVVPTSSEKSIPAVVPTSSEKSTSAVVPTSSEKSIPAVVPTSSEKSTSAVVPTSSEKSTSAVEPTSSEKSIPAVVPTSSEKSIPAVVPTSSEKSTSAVVPTSSEKSIPAVVPTSSEKSIPAVVPTSSEKSIPAVVPTSSEKSILAVVPTSSEKSIPAVVPTSSEKSTSAVEPTSSEKSIPAVVPTSSEKSIPAVVPTSSAKSIPAVVPTSSEKSIPAVVPTSSEKSIPAVVPTPSEKSIPAVVPTPSAKSIPAVVPTSSEKSIPAVVPTSSEKSIPAVVPTSSEKSIPAVVPTSSEKSISAVVPTPSEKSIPAVVPTPSEKSIPAVVPTPSEKSIPAVVPTSSEKSISAVVPTPSEKSISAVVPTPSEKSIPAVVPTSSEKSISAVVPTSSEKSIPAVVPTSSEKSISAVVPTPSEKSIPAVVPTPSEKSIPAVVPTPSEKSIPAVVPTSSEKSISAVVPTPSEKSISAVVPTPSEKSIPAVVPTSSEKSISAVVPTSSEKSIPAVVPTSSEKSIPAVVPTSSAKSTSPVVPTSSAKSTSAVEPTSSEKSISAVVPTSSANSTSAVVLPKSLVTSPHTHVTTKDTHTTLLVASQNVTLQTATPEVVSSQTKVVIATTKHSVVVTPISVLPSYSTITQQHTSSLLVATPTLTSSPSTGVRVFPSPSSEVLTPTKTSKELTSSSIGTPIVKYYEYHLVFILTDVEETEENEKDYKLLSLLITECQPQYTEENSPYFLAFQTYIQKQICEFYAEETCSVVVLRLSCGSLKPELEVTTTKNTTEPINDVVKNGKIGDFSVNKKSFSSQYRGEDITKPTQPTEKPKAYKPDVYVVVTLGYTWKEFCHVVIDHFKESIVEGLYDFDGKRLSGSDVVIINKDKNCVASPDDKDEEIEVLFFIIGKKQTKLTIHAGEHLMDLVDTKRTGKLGNLLENKIIKVEFSGKASPSKSGLSDSDRIWLAVGVILGVLLILLFFYLCCCRKNQKSQDPENGPTFFSLDEMDNSKQAMDNQGFDDNVEAQPQVSTFKGENGNKPAIATEEGLGQAPLGDEEESDDELGMTVPDVAIESEDEGKNEYTTPAGTLPIIPPEPAHMAVQDLPKFLKEAGDEPTKSKEYKDLDNSTTEPNIYPPNNVEKNRSEALVPNPETRVKLPGDHDYINANYMKDHNGKTGFIATQHPLSNTMKDFWELIWEQDVSVIVMVNDKEKDMENYHNYWMDHKNSLTIYGHMQVKTYHMESRQGYNLTRFILQNSHRSDIAKTVNHFRFTNWKDGDICDVENFAQFVRSVESVRSQNSTSPTLVHCSDGQGLTGVFMASDIGLRVYNESDKKYMINVFDCVEKLRKDRHRIVCTKELYNLIFKVLSAIVKIKDEVDSKL